MKKLALIFVLAAGPAAGAAPDPLILESRQLRLADDPGWRALLHVTRDIFGRVRSGIDDPDFFLHPDGRLDPAKELEATIAAFAGDAGDGDDPAACRYPARFLWLSRRLDLEALSPAGCPRLDAWREKLNADAVSVVFASYYFNNPASLYGHTFLKLKRAGYAAAGGLLDYTVNYAAITDTRNGVLFAVKGLAGGYQGRFSTEPYYIKIQQYNNLEARDLWEYPLDLDAGELDLLVRHLWELGPHSLTYYFFNRNCSYQLMPLLEAVRPDLPLSKRFRYRAIPLDTLQAITGNGRLAGEPLYRPSHVRLMKERRERLSVDERRLARELGKGWTEPNGALAAIPADRRADVLDSALDVWRLDAGFARDLPEATRERERALLLARNALPAKRRPLEIDAPVPPHVAHPSGRVRAGFGADKDNVFAEIGVRAALHDLEADPAGFVEGSELEMFDIRVRVGEGDNDPYLEEFTFVNIVSLVPWDPWIPSPSWAVKAGLEVAHDLGADADDALVGAVSGGSGLSLPIALGKGTVFYALAKGEGAAGEPLRDGWRAGFGAEVGALARITSAFRLHVSGSAFRFGAGDVGNRVRLRTVAAVDLTRRVEARFGWLREDGYAEGTVTLMQYW